MGVLQNQVNSALTGLTFLAQQTPQWQYGKEKAVADSKLNSIKKGYEKAIEASRDRVKEVESSEDKELKDIVNSTHAELLNESLEKTSDFIKQNSEYFPEDYSRVVLGETAKKHILKAQESAQAVNNAQESAQARQTEIQTIDSNMKNYVEMIREMRANGIIKSNRQAKSMIYKAEHQEDKK